MAGIEGSTPSRPTTNNTFLLSEEDIIDSNQFHNFLLQRMTDKTAVDRIRYARQYANCSPASILQLAPNKRIHIMKSLSCLAKFTGRSNQWREIIQQYQLSWGTGTEKIDAFARFFDDSKPLDSMIDSLREAMRGLPSRYYNLLLFCIT